MLTGLQERGVLGTLGLVGGLGALGAKFGGLFGGLIGAGLGLVIAALPAAAGKKHDMSGGKGNPVNRHFMSEVIPSIEAEKAEDEAIPMVYKEIKMKTLRRLICSLLTGLALFSVVIPGHGSTNMKQAAPEVYFSGTQLQLAQAIAEHDLSEVKALSKGTDLNKPGSQSMTMLMYALLEATNGDGRSLSIVTELVKEGADPLQDIPDFGSPAAVMASSNDPTYIKALIDGGLSPNAMTNYQPLIFNSASDNSFAVLKYLLSAGADVNKTDGAGKTVLMSALAGMELDQVEYLLNHGANPNTENQNGLNFGKMLSDVIDREKNSNKRTVDKLEELRKLAIRKGLHWPPAKD